MNLCISPRGWLFAETAPDSNEGAAKRIIEAFADSSSRGILHLSTTELQASLPADFSFARDFGRAYLTQLCHTPEIAGQAEFPPVSPPTEGDLAAMVLSAPPMRGLEYLNADLLKEWWADLDILCERKCRRRATACRNTFGNGIHCGGRSGGCRFTWRKTSVIPTIRSLSWRRTRVGFQRRDGCSTCHWGGR